MTVPEELRALDAAGVPYRLRKEASAPPADALEGERDVELAAADLDRAARALADTGWVRIHSPDPRHAFFVNVREGRWAKLDAKLTGVADGKRARRRGPLVAFVGPDGAGKSTVVTELSRRIPFGVRVAYLGGRGGAARVASARRPKETRKTVLRETAGVVRDTLRAARLLAREHWASRRGAIVLCDRHPKEILVVRPRRPRPAAALERFLVRRLLPWPDAIVVLHAPVEVLHARKPEHPVERLEGWLRAYEDELGPRGAAFLDTTEPRAATVRAASELVWREVARRMAE